MIEIKNIHKSFDGNTIIKGISTSFEKGKTNLIIGQSGSGKTVLLKCLLGLHNPDSGEIIYDGVSNLEMTESELYDFATWSHHEIDTKRGEVRLWVWQIRWVVDSFHQAQTRIGRLRFFYPRSRQLQEGRVLRGIAEPMF